MNKNSKTKLRAVVASLVAAVLMCVGAGTVIAAPAKVGLVFVTADSPTPKRLMGAAVPANAQIFVTATPVIWEVAYSIDGAAPFVANSVPSKSLAAGNHTIEAEIISVTGNVAVVTADFSVSGTAAPAQPTAPTVSPPLSTSPTPNATTGALQVSQDGYFQYPDGRRFFWMGDTAWSLFVNLDRDQTIQYLDNRAQKGFTVIQAVAISPPSGGLGPNAHGDSPYEGDLGQLSITEGASPLDELQYDYWDHVEFVIAEAAARGMYVALLPAWSSAVAGDSLTAENAGAYGEFLGERYARQYDNLIWMMGGDDNEGFYPEIWSALARGVAVGQTGTENYAANLMTYHPGGGKNSASELDGEPWLDFHTYQSGHAPIGDSVWNNLELAQQTGKPFLDSEPGYEDHPISFDSANGYLTADDVRKTAWLEVFVGAAGHTYGHHNIWMMYGANKGGSGAEPLDINWDVAMDADGAFQMGHLSKFMQSLTVPWVADNSVLTTSSERGSGPVALTAVDGSYIVVYSPSGEAVSLSTPPAGQAYWLDPRTGDTVAASASGGSFQPPSQGDWALVVGTIV